MKDKTKYEIEDHVDDWVKKQLDGLKLVNQRDYHTKGAMPDSLKEALTGRAKTRSKANFGIPDFSITKYGKTPVIIENKLGIRKLIAETINGIKFDANSIGNYAVNGALYYATGIIKSGQYRDAIAIGIAGDDEENVEIKAYYVFGHGETSFKLLGDVKTLDFLESKKTFNDLYNSAVLTDKEKHDILINSKAELKKYAKKLNKLMHNHNITTSQRVLYISGMLLAMQNITNTEEVLVPGDLKGKQADSTRDGIQVTNKIIEFLTDRKLPSDKQNLMLSSFLAISKDKQRDKLTELDKIVSKDITDEKASINKQIFTYIYKNIFLSIDSMTGHLDIMGEMYSEFLKYALGDGKVGIVLTPPYVTKMMATILGINKNSKVMDLATGSAGFLISAMEAMIADAEKKHGKQTTKAMKKINAIKSKQLLGVELNADMFTLAATNMILRGDGSTNIHKGDTFEEPKGLYANFKADKLLLNPPFSFYGKGMPFIAFGLDNMGKGGLGAIIIHDSAGSGSREAQEINKSILKKHTLKASIKMPIDLFQPMVGVQTSIYIFEAHKPHDFEQTVKFIDFRDDGYKRTSRGLQEYNDPTKRYADIVNIFKAGTSAIVEADWDLKEIYNEDFITDSGSDWNFEQHKIIETKPTLRDFKKTVSDYLAWEVSNILKDQNKGHGKTDVKLSKRLEKVEWNEFELGELFEVVASKKIYHANKIEIFDEQVEGSIPYVVRSAKNNGIRGYIIDNEEYANGKNTLSFAQDTFCVFYQKQKYFTGNKIKILKAKFANPNEKNMQYFAASFQKSLNTLTWGTGSTIHTIAKTKIKIPTKNGKINFKFMEKFVMELEAQRIAELEAYLVSTGLKITI